MTVINETLVEITLEYIQETLKKDEEIPLFIKGALYGRVDLLALLLLISQETKDLLIKEITNHK